MRKLILIGDGDRDCEALPTLVAKLLEEDLNCEFRRWKDIRHFKGSGSAYSKKLKFLVRVAIDDGKVDGLTAVLDTDNAAPRSKVRDLETARIETRNRGHSIPVALGEANPHFDVWLLDDRKAVVSALEVSESRVPDSRSSGYPKDTLDKLLVESKKEFTSISEGLKAVAQEWRLDRCIHRDVN